ncbi:hypothetical protein ACOMHN_051850 [Nucella lapillus]
MVTGYLARDGGSAALQEAWRGTVAVHCWSQVVKFSASVSGSQAIMLLALYDKYTSLDRKWNRLYRIQTLHEGPRSHLMHWNGADKPWNTHVNNDNVWWKYFKLSRAYDSRADG